MANTLYEFYKSKGQALPSVGARTADATAAGISGYTGTAQQNAQLLSYLSKPPATAGATSTNTNGNVGNVNTGTPTPNTAVGDFLNNPLVAPENQDYLNAANNLLAQSKTAMDSTVDENAIRSQVLARYQAEIDATNNIFADKLNRAKKTGEGNIGMTRATNARAGLLGSDFGTANAAGTEAANEEVYSAIDNEKAAAIGSILSKVRTGAAEELEKKTAAKVKGAEDYIKYLSESATVKQNNAKKAVKAILAKGIDIKDFNAEQLKQMASSLGVSTNDLVSLYNDDKLAAEDAGLERKKTTAEIEKLNADIAKGKYIELGEGEMLYDPTTGKTFKNPKTFAPTGSGSSSVIPGVPGSLSPLAQAVQNGTITLAQIPAKDRSSVAGELATYKGLQSNRQITLQSNLDAVNSLLNNGSLSQITGIPNPFTVFTPGTKAQLAKNQYNQVKGILSLENREKLKGSGAISDFEFKILSEAATALGRNLSDKDFKAQLQKVKEVFEGKYADTYIGGSQVPPNDSALTPGQFNQADPLGIRD